MILHLIASRQYIGALDELELYVPSYFRIDFADILPGTSPRRRSRRTPPSMLTRDSFVCTWPNLIAPRTCRMKAAHSAMRNNTSTAHGTWIRTTWWRRFGRMPYVVSPQRNESNTQKDVNLAGSSAQFFGRRSRDTSLGR